MSPATRRDRAGSAPRASAARQRESRRGTCRSALRRLDRSPSAQHGVSPPSRGTDRAIPPTIAGTRRRSTDWCRMTLHPSPQLRRRDWVDLQGTWDFAYDDADVGLAQGWFDRPDCFDRTITVPFPPESKASGIGDPSEHAIVWYRRTFRLDEVPGYGRGRRINLHFGAVDYEARVFVNGRFVGRHEGGHSSFAFDITDALGGDGEQAVVVRAEDRPRDLTQPRGKQTWESEPRRIWYHRTTG